MAVIGKQLLSASSRNAREREDDDLDEVRALLTPGKSTRAGSLVDSDRAHDISEAASSPGEVLPADIARRLAAELGIDVRDVRIHTDERAAKAAAAIAARAFSVGNDIYFAAGAYQPGTDETDRLLAREVVQIVHGQTHSGRGDDAVRERKQQHESLQKGDPGALVDNMRAKAKRVDLPFVRELENHFETSFDYVEAYTGEAAELACRLMEAGAFAVRNVIALADASPQRDTLMHELTHVIQSGGRAARAPEKFGAGSLNIGAAGTSVEREASMHVARPTFSADANTVHRDKGGTDDKSVDAQRLVDYATKKAGVPAAGDKTKLAFAFKDGDGRAAERYYAASAPFTLSAYTDAGGTKADLDDALGKDGAIGDSGLRLHQNGNRYVISRDLKDGNNYQKAVVKVTIEDRWKDYRDGCKKIEGAKSGAKIAFTWTSAGKDLHEDDPATNEPEFKDYREKMRDAIADIYANGDGAYGDFYTQVCQKRLFPVKTVGSIFEALVAKCAKNDDGGVDGGESATSKIPVWDKKTKESKAILKKLKKDRLDGDGVVTVQGGTVAITEAKAYATGNGPSGSDTKKMGDYYELIKSGVPGYVNFGGNEPTPVTFNHVFYNIAAPPQKADGTWEDKKVKPTLTTWVKAIGKAFDEPYEAGKIPTHYSMHPPPDGSYDFTIKFNPEFQFEVPANTKSINLTPPGPFVPGLKISKVQASVDDNQMITGGSVVYSIDAGELKKPEQTKPITPMKDAPGGQVDNKIKGLSSKIADTLPVDIDASIVDGGVEASITLKQGAVKGLAGFTVDTAVIKATYLAEGSLTAEGEFAVHHVNGKISAKVKVGYDGDWSFTGKVTVSEGFIPGVKGIDGIGISWSAKGGWKISADSFTIEQKLGAVTITGTGSALEYDVHNGAFKGDLDINADLGMFGKASGSASIVNNKLTKGSISYDSPEFKYPAKGDKPAFVGTVGGTLKYNDGKLSGDIKGSANINVPALQKIAGEKGIALDVAGHIDENGAFSGTIKETNPLKFGKYLEIPKLQCSIDKDGSVSGDFTIKVVNLKYLEKAEVACTVNKDGITIKSANVTVAFGDQAKGSFWGSLSAGYTEEKGLDISGTVNYKIKDDMIAVGTLKYDQATNAVSLEMKVEEITLVDKKISKTLFKASKQIPVVNVYGLGIYVDIGFDLGFDFGFKLTMTPEVDFVGLSLDTWKFEKIAAKLKIGGDVFAQLTGTPKLGIGVFALDPSIIRGGGGLKVPIVGRLDIKPSGEFGVSYKPDGGVDGTAKLGLAGQFGITGSLKPYAEFSVLNDMWNPTWEGEALASFEILKPKELFNFTVDFAGDNKDLKDGPQLPEQNSAQAPREPTGDKTAKATPGPESDKGGDKSASQPAKQGEVAESGDQGPFSLEGLLEKFKGNKTVATAEKIFGWAKKVWKVVKPIWDIVEPIVDLIGKRIEAIIDLFDIEAPTGENLVPWLFKLAGKLWNVAFGGLSDIAHAIRTIFGAAVAFAKKFITKAVMDGQIGVKRHSYYIWMPWPKDNIEFMAAAEYKVVIPGVVSLGPDGPPGFLLRPSGAISLVLYEALEAVGIGYSYVGNSDINQPYNDIWYGSGARG